MSDAQVAMVRDGWPRARAAGWSRDEWLLDCAALLGVSLGHAENILYRKRYQFRKDGDG